MVLVQVLVPRRAVQEPEPARLGCCLFFSRPGRPAGLVPNPDLPMSPRAIFYFWLLVLVLVQIFGGWFLV